MIYSLDLERSALGGLLRNPEVFFELDSFINESDLFLKNHQTIYSIIKNTLLKQEKIDKVLIAEKIKNLGIKFNGEVNIADYLEDISFSPATPAQTIKYFKELSLLRVRREIFEIGENLKQTVSKGEFNSFNDIIAKSDAIYNQTIKSYSDVDAPLNIFDDLYEMVEERGNNPVEDYGYKTPFDNFNRLYGGLRPKNLYAFAARAGQGKSSLLSATALGCHLINPKVKVLYLDTEMSLIEQQTRMAANLSGVPLWYIETGNYRKNQEYINKVRDALSTVKKYQYYHYQVANKDIDEVCSIIRRWYFSKVGRGNPALVIYDYVKLGSSEKIGQNWAEHQQIGTMVDKLKRISEEINAPLLTAIQLNRSGEAQGKVAVDDSSSFALSDRLQWFASFTGIFRAKTADELSADGADFGTHKLIKTKSRWQGKDAKGFNDFIKRKMPDGAERYVANYINFDIANFKITEKGTLQDVIDRQDHDYDLKDDKNPNEKLLD